MSLRFASKQFRMWMPVMPMTLISTQNATATKPAKAAFRVLPKMTKHEVKEYLTKIYNLPVAKVRTMNYLGRRKKILGQRKIVYLKYPDWKKAVVDFHKSVKDLGMSDMKGKC